MKVTLSQNTCTIERQISDKIPRGGSWGSAESQLYFWIKKNLQQQGYDVIKRRMQSDGHMYGDDKLPYIRDRKHKFYIYDGNYMVRSLVEAFKTGTVVLLVQRN